MADLPTLGAVSSGSAPPRPVSRRTLLGGALAAGLSGFAGCAPGPDPDRAGAYCVSRGTLERRRAIGGLPLVYAPSGSRQAFWFEPAFAGQLDAWVDGLAADLGRPATRLDTYGSWIDGGGACDSWHHAGRAFDLAVLRLTGGGVVSCRYDQWRTRRTAELTPIRRAYWALAAGLHLRFAYVLTYLYDARHANHIHLDNGRSGPDLSRFQSGSRVQVQAVQAILSYLWDEPVELTSRWDAATRAATARVLDDLELPGDLGDPQAWPGFLRASAARAR